MLNKLPQILSHCLDYLAIEILKKLKYGCVKLRDKKFCIQKVHHFKTK